MKLKLAGKLCGSPSKITFRPHPRSLKKIVRVLLKVFWVAIAMSFTTSALSINLASAKEAPVVGRKAAAKYFAQAEESKEYPSSGKERRGGGGDELLMLHLGGYSSSTSYAWKDSQKRTGVGKASYGITYLFDEWSGMDLNLRFDFNEFQIDDERATKLSVLPLITFPRAEKRFPLYFGFGVGAGVFFSQLQDESNLSLDYQLVLGFRYLDVLDNLGFFVEFGMKNHLHILSDGQFNGMPLTGGVSFTF